MFRLGSRFGGVAARRRRLPCTRPTKPQSSSTNRDKRQSFNEASFWIFAKVIFTSSLSFDHVCEALGLDAKSLRRRLGVGFRARQFDLLREYTIHYVVKPI